MLSVHIYVYIYDYGCPFVACWTCLLAVNIAFVSGRSSSNNILSRVRESESSTGLFILIRVISHEIVNSPANAYIPVLEWIVWTVQFYGGSVSVSISTE